jgi:hypothetical protein
VIIRVPEFWDWHARLLGEMMWAETRLIDSPWFSYKMDGAMPSSAVHPDHFPGIVLCASLT